MWKTYTNYPQMWEAMLADIKAAKTSINFEQYIFTDLEEGSIGKKFIDAFKRKAEEGVAVKLLLDGQGSVALAFSQELPKMEEAGVQVMFYVASSHKLRNFAIFKSFFRDHRKLLIVDDKVAHIGGGIVQNKAKDWGELNVRLENMEVVKNLSDSFNTVWEYLEKGNAFVVLKPQTDKEGFVVLESSPRKNEHYVLEHLIKGIKSAQNYVLIVTPYFVPTYKLLRQIVKAKKRGVDVKIILPQQIDNIFAKYASYYYYEGLLKKGVEMFLYAGYNHAKATVVDGKWCTFGSTNMDRMALVHNYEINIASTDREFVKSIERCFEAYLSKCQKLTLEKWKQRLFVTKLLEKLSFVVRPWA